MRSMFGSTLFRFFEYFQTFLDEMEKLLNLFADQRVCEAGASWCLQSCSRCPSSSTACLLISDCCRSANYFFKINDLIAFPCSITTHVWEDGLHGWVCYYVNSTLWVLFHPSSGCCSLLNMTGPSTSRFETVSWPAMKTFLQRWETGSRHGAYIHTCCMSSGQRVWDRFTEISNLPPSFAALTPSRLQQPTDKQHCCL